MRIHDILVAATAVAAATSTLPAQTIAITGAKIYPVSGPVIEHGTVVIRDGKIAAVGSDVSTPAGARVIDGTGKVVTPGLVNAATLLGVTEIGAVQSTNDASANPKDGIAAAFRVWDGFNPSSVLLQPAREGGITTVIIEPRGGLIAGQAAAMHLVEGDAGDMLLRGPVGMMVTVGPALFGAPASRGVTLMRLREVLEDARAYRQRKSEFERNQTRSFSASRLDLDALQPVLDGKEPLIIDADKASDIESALSLAKEFGIKPIIAGGAEAWEVADKLAVAKVPVITGAMNNIPSSFAELGQRQENAGLLARAGVPVMLMGNAGGGDEEAFNVRNVRFEAGNAVAYGMDWNAALRAITLTPAEVFGIADRVGSLTAGRDADVVVWSGDPFEFATQPEHVFIHGREDTTPSRQDLLEQRYKNLPPSYKLP